LQDTLIIITSDHGDNIGESGFMGHEFSLSESILRIPMIIHYPPLFPAGTQIDHPVQLVDILPTILDIIGAESETEVQGRSLTPRNWDDLTDRYTISELFHPNEEIVQKRYSHLDVDQFLCDWKAIRHNGYKYLWSSRGNHRLYNIADDPAERTNLVERESVVAKNMMDKLDQWKNSFEAYSDESNPEDLDQRTIERLKKLGYID
jgi:arylsulfatase A-like enzyme